SAVFRRGLAGLLEGADLVERGLVGDVGDGAVRALVAVVAGNLAPALGRHAALFSKQGNEDLGLLLAVTGKCLEALEQFRTRRVAPGPDRRRVAVVLVDDVLAERLNALGHGAAVTMDGRRRGAQRGELLRVV